VEKKAWTAMPKDSDQRGRQEQTEALSSRMTSLEGMLRQFIESSADVGRDQEIDHDHGKVSELISARL
jgi:hypothetical protein